MGDRCGLGVAQEELQVENPVGCDWELGMLRSIVGGLELPIAEGAPCSRGGTILLQMDHLAPEGSSCSRGSTLLQ